MTLSERNTFFKAGIVLAFGFLVVIAAVSHTILPVYPELTAAAGQRSGGIIQSLIGRFFQPAPYVPFVTMTLSAAYAFITIILIYYFFEKTQAPEILFIAFFILSFAFEAARIMVPLKVIRELPMVYLIVTSRVLLFGRYFGIFSLFTASVYASGLEAQKQGPGIFIILITTLVIALGVPIDGFSWDSSLSMLYGYSSMFKLVETGLVLITAISFFVSAYSRGAREYVFIGLGSFLVSLGRTVLLGADTWAAPLPGLLILGTGTWFICSYLHRVYLWL
jgi:hypothetical protein